MKQAMRKGPVFKSNAQGPRSERTGTGIVVIAEDPSVLLNAGCCWELSHSGMTH